MKPAAEELKNDTKRRIHDLNIRFFAAVVLIVFQLIYIFQLGYLFKDSIR